MVYSRSLIKIGLVVSVVFLFGCSRIDRRDSGGVVLYVSDFSAVTQVQANLGQVPMFETLSLASRVLDPTAETTPAMDIILRFFKVECKRIDGGSMHPAPFIRGITGTVPAGGTTDYTNLPLLGLEHIQNPPISYLLYENGGMDPETNSTLISLNCEVEFYGRTVGGKDIDSEDIHIYVYYTP